MGLAALAIEIFGLIPYAFPASFYVWFGFAVAAILLTAVGWRHDRLRRKLLGIASTAITATAALTLVNKQYGYYPTLSSLWGSGSLNQVSQAEFDALRATARQTDSLPAKGVTVSVHVPATTSGFEARPALVYLPPAWFATPTPQLPAIVLVPGVPSQVTDWTRSGLADQTADAFAAQHQGQAPIVVIADQNGSLEGDTECVDSSLGRVETYVVTDIPAYLRSTFSVATAATSLAIAGLSAGGTCALVVALRNPGVYPTFADYSGYASPALDSDAQTLATLFGGSQAAETAHDPAAIFASKRFTGSAGWFEVGTADAEPLAAQRSISALTVTAGIDTCTREIPWGQHSFTVWAEAFRDSLPWLSGRLGLTPRPPPRRPPAPPAPPPEVRHR